MIRSKTWAIAKPLGRREEALGGWLEGLMWMTDSEFRKLSPYNWYPSPPKTLSTLRKDAKAQVASVQWVGTKCGNSSFRKQSRGAWKNSLHFSCLWFVNTYWRKISLKNLFSEKQVRSKQGAQHSRHWFGAEDNLRPVSLVKVSG